MNQWKWMPDLGRLRQVKWVRSIGFKLFAAFLVSIVLTCAAAGWIAYSISSQALKEKVGNNMDQVVADAAGHIDRWVKTMDGMFNQLVVYSDKNKFLTKDRRWLEPQTGPEAAELKQLREALADWDEKIEAARQAQPNAAEKDEKIKLNDTIVYASQQRNKLIPRYNELLVDKTANDDAINNYISTLTLTNADMIYSVGIIRYNNEHQTFTTFSKTLQDNLFGSAWATDVLGAKGKNVMLPPKQGSYLYTDTETRVLAVGKSFYSSEDQQWADLIIVEFKLSYFENMLAPITFGGIGDIHLVGEDSRTIYSNRQGIAMGDVSAVPLSGESVLKTHESEMGTYLTTFRPLENRSWWLAGSIPVDLLLSDAKTIQTGLVYLMIGGFVLALLLGLWVYRTIGLPLLQAEKKMLRAEEGDLQVRLGLRRSDEIGSVGRSFDRMMERIGGIVDQTGRSADQLMNAMNEIHHLTVQSQSASKEIAVAMDEVSSGAESLARDAEKSSVLTGELNSRLEDVVQHNERMKDISLQVEQSSRAGIASMEQLAQHNKEAEQVVVQLVEKIDQLKAGTSSITGVMDILDNIAKQINILSLNASIVAASSGEAGKSFMVVAQEIRLLANQSKEAITSVDGIIDSILTDMAETGQLVHASLPIFEKQSAVSRTSQQTFQEVEVHMQQFVDRFAQVWDSLQVSMDSQKQLTEMMMQVSAVSEESTAATENVASLVNQQYTLSGKMVETGEHLEQLSNQLRAALGVFQSKSGHTATLEADTDSGAVQPLPEHEAFAAAAQEQQDDAEKQ